ncbi:MAG: hypothetical protein IJW21_07530 [Clostridia bacterium]|nr:hypothetical protein [Clostridia bacterium]
MLALPTLFIMLLGAVSADEPKELAVIIALSVLFALGAAIFVYAALNTGKVIRNLQNAHAPEASFKTVRCTQIRPIKKISASSSARIPQYSLGMVLLCEGGQKYRYFFDNPIEMSKFYILSSELIGRIEIRTYSASDIIFEIKETE